LGSGLPVSESETVRETEAHEEHQQKTGEEREGNADDPEGTADYLFAVTCLNSAQTAFR